MKKRLAMMAVMCFVALSLLVGCGGGGGGDSTPAPTTATLRLINNSTVSVTDVRISTVNSNNWGVNQLSSAVAPNTTRDIINIPVGTYDLRATSSNAQIVYHYAQSLPAGVTPWTFTAAKETLELQTEIGGTVSGEPNDGQNIYSPSIDGQGDLKEIPAP